MKTEPEKRKQAMQNSETAASTSRSLDSLNKAREIRLKTALANLAEGKLATATGTFLELYAERPLTPQGSLAADKLNLIAESYESGGQMRLAVELYEKLAAVAE